MAKDLMTSFKEQRESIRQRHEDTGLRTEKYSYLMGLTDKEFGELVKRYNMDVNEAYVRDNEVIFRKDREFPILKDMEAKVFIERFGHKKGLTKIVNGNKTYYGPISIVLDYGQRSAYNIPHGAEAMIGHSKEMAKRNIFEIFEELESESLGFTDCLYQKKFTHKGIPHTECIMHSPLHNALIYLEFDVSETLCSEYSRDKLTVLVPIANNGHQRPTIRPLILDLNRPHLLGNNLLNLSTRGEIASAYPEVGKNDFPHFVTAEDKEALRNFHDTDRRELSTSVSASKIESTKELLAVFSWMPPVNKVKKQNEQQKQAV